MKKLLFVLTTALAAATFTAGTVAYAEEAAATDYPVLASQLAFSSLTTYAVTDDETGFAFAEGRYIYLFEGSEVTGGTYSGTLANDGTTLYYYEHTGNITDLTYDGTTLVFTDGSGVYSLTDGVAESYSYTFSYSSYEEYGGILYSIDGGCLYFYAGQSNVGSLFDGTYSAVKIFGSCLYVIKDNVLCKVSGTTVSDITVTPLTFEYLDLTLGETISTDGAEDALKTVQSTVKYVTLSVGTYVTHVDISDLTGDYFAVSTGGTFALTAKTKYLYLGSLGNVYILADGSDVYLASGANAAEEDVALGSYESTAARMNTACNIYSMPYICDSTVIGTVDAETEVTVNGIIANDGTLQCGFASVTVTAADGTVVTGYVPSNFITAYYFTAENGEYNEAEYTDEYADDNVILSVCLVMVIVVLVIVGIIYLSYAAGASRRRENGEDQK